MVSFANMVDVGRISISIEVKNEICQLTLMHSIRNFSHSARKKCLIWNFVKSDAVILWKLESGSSISKVFRIELSSDDKIVRLIVPFILPLRITDDLYDYQRVGVAWLLRHRRGVLADDMGLGKTFQAISALRRLVRFGRISWALVVAPKSLVSNWLDELTRWAPELAVAAVGRDEISKYGWLKLIFGNHVLVTTYDVLRGDIEKVKENAPDLIIADEAHRLRKKDSLTFRSFRQINSKFLWALTGTPIERSTEDLITIMSLVDPRLFSPGDLHIHRTSLQSRVRPFVLRRTKNEVLSQLPPVLERVEAIELSDRQRKSYDAIVRSTQFRNHLARFSKLKEICDYDEQSGESSKIERILEIVSDIALAGEKVVIFSYTLAPLSLLAQRLNSLGLAFRSILGEQPISMRSSVVDEFKTRREIVVLLASTRVASEGLTLTEANNVIFVNKWWNPSTNIQARDRVVRIGQKKVVQVISFKSVRTIEESLENILARKLKTYEQVISAIEKTGIDGIALI